MVETGGGGGIHPTALLTKVNLLDCNGALLRNAKTVESIRLFLHQAASKRLI